MKHSLLKSYRWKSDRWKIFCKPVIPLPLLIVLIMMMSVQNSKAADSFQVTKIGQGRPVVLIPGLMSDGRVWEPVKQQLAQSHELHIISLAGFGNVDSAGESSLARVKRDLLDYFKQQQMDKPILVGHSLGGFMGFWIATTHPQAIGGVVSVDGLPFIGPVFTRSNATTADALRPQAEQFRLMYRSMTPQQLRAQTQMGISIQARSTQHRDIILNMSEQSDPAMVADAMHTIMLTDLRQSLEGNPLPMLMLGASGAFQSESQHQQIAALYQAQFKEVPNASVKMNSTARHFIMYDDPEWLLKQLTQFLESNS